MIEAARCTGPAAGRPSPYRMRSIFRVSLSLPVARLQKYTPAGNHVDRTPGCQAFARGARPPYETRPRDRCSLDVAQSLICTDTRPPPVTKPVEPRVYHPRVFEDGIYLLRADINEVMMTRAVCIAPHDGPDTYLRRSRPARNQRPPARGCAVCRTSAARSRPA